MEYFEQNLFNASVIVPYHEKRPIHLCPQTEIIGFHNMKRLLLPQYPLAEWKLFIYHDFSYYYTWVSTNDFHHSRYGDIYETGFFVMVERPRFFDMLRNGESADWTRWLIESWDTQFLVTVPVLRFVPKSSSMSPVYIDYFIPNTYPVRKRVTDVSPSADLLEHILDEKGYTMANGFTMFLTLVKGGVIDLATARSATTRLFFQRGHELFHEVTERWHHLYYEHPAMHVCDNPWFFANMGASPVPLDLLQMLQPEDDDYIINMQHGFVHNVSTTKTLMLPHFNPRRWEEFKGEAWYVCPVELTTDDRYFPNVTALYVGVTRSRAAWAWWKRNYREYFEGVREAMRSTCDIHFMEFMLQPILHLYNTAKEYSPRLCYSKLRQLWNQVLTYFQPSADSIIRMIQKWGIKFTFVHTLRVVESMSSISWEFAPPFVFLKDVIERYKEACALYEPITLRVYSDFERILVRHFPMVERVSNEEGRHLLTRFETMELFRMSPRKSSFYHIYKSYLLPRIKSRLQALYHGFGMFEGQESTKWEHVAGIHTVGFLVMEHIKKNKDILYA